MSTLLLIPGVLLLSLVVDLLVVGLWLSRQNENELVENLRKGTLSKREASRYSRSQFYLGLMLLPQKGADPAPVVFIFVLAGACIVGALR